MTSEAEAFSDAAYDRLDDQGIFSGYVIRAKLTGAFDTDMPAPAQRENPRGLRGYELARAVLNGEIDYRDIPVL
jgi:hypothetical protein